MMQQSMTKVVSRSKKANKMMKIKVMVLMRRLKTLIIKIPPVALLYLKIWIWTRKTLKRPLRSLKMK